MVMALALLVIGVVSGCGTFLAECCAPSLALLTYPLHVPTSPLGLLWSLPICLSIAAVYKAIKLETFDWHTFIRETILLFVTIIGFLIAIGAALVLLGYLVKVF